MRSVGPPGNGFRRVLCVVIGRRDVVEAEAPIVDVAQIHSGVEMGAPDRDIQTAVGSKSVRSSPVEKRVR